jgi:3-phenylpropionate/trans-cinnamate dioxygenase ferredoxin subunit
MHTETIGRTSFLSGLLTPQKVFIKAAHIDDLEINEMKSLKLKGKSVILCRSERGYFALQDKCSYGKYQLSQGVMINSTIQCLIHGCQYSVESGNVKKGPAKKPVRTYKTLIKDGYVYIKI